MQRFEGDKNTYHDSLYFITITATDLTLPLRHLYLNSYRTLLTFMSVLAVKNSI